MKHVTVQFLRKEAKETRKYKGISVTSLVGRLYGQILKSKIELEYEDVEIKS